MINFIAILSDLQPYVMHTFVKRGAEPYIREYGQLESCAPCLLPTADASKRLDQIHRVSIFAGCQSMAQQFSIKQDTVSDVSRHVPLSHSPSVMSGEDPGHGGGTMTFGRPGYALVCFPKSWQ